MDFPSVKQKASYPMTVLGHSTMDINTRIDRLEAIETIRHVVHQYCHAFDKRDADEFVSIWTPEAVWSAGPGHHVRGRNEIRQAAESMWAQFGTTHHWSTNVMVDVEGNEARAVVDLHAFAQAGGSWTQTAATYRDDFRLIAGVWLLARRQTDVHHTFALPDPIN